MNKSKRDHESRGRSDLPTSFRLSPQAHGLLARLAEALGLSKTGVLELAVRQLARREGVELPPAEPGPGGKRR